MDKCPGLRVLENAAMLRPLPAACPVHWWRSSLVARLVPDEGTARLHGSARPAPPGPFSKAVGTDEEARGVDLAMPLASAVKERRQPSIERIVRYFGMRSMMPSKSRRRSSECGTYLPRTRTWSAPAKSSPTSDRSMSASGIDHHHQPRVAVDPHGCCHPTAFAGAPAIREKGHVQLDLENLEIRQWLVA